MRVPNAMHPMTKSFALGLLLTTSLSQMARAERVAMPVSYVKPVRLQYQDEVVPQNQSEYQRAVAQLMNEPIAQNRKSQKLNAVGNKVDAALFYLIDGAEDAGVVGDDRYNFTIKSYQYINKELAFARVPMSLYRILRDTQACDINVNGPCVVVDRDIDLNLEAFVVGTALDKGQVKIFRKEIRVTNSNKQIIQFLNDSENREMTVYTFASSGETTADRSDEVESEVEKQKAAIEILTDEKEISKAEKEIESVIAKGSKEAAAELRNQKRTSKYGKCVVGGYLETKAIQILFVRVDFSEKVKVVLPGDDRPLMKGKGKLLCYMPDKTVARIKIEAKIFSDLSVGAMMGKMYFGSLGIGLADSPFDLIQTRKSDGTVVPYREWAFFPFMNVDAAYIVGAGASLPGFSSGRYQKPILNIFTGRVGVGAVGARWGIFEKGRIGIDPDDL